MQPPGAEPCGSRCAYAHRDRAKSLCLWQWHVQRRTRSDRRGGQIAVDKEARLNGTTTAQHPPALRLWLRLLTCAQLIEHQVRDGLRTQFDTTPPRFDFMAQLERSPKGMKMNELSSRMMVTRGNITGIANQLVTAGLVTRVDVVGDKRACRVKLTPKGRKQFIVLAREHDKWIVQAFAALGEKNITSLHTLLGRVKAGILKNMPPLK